MKWSEKCKESFIEVKKMLNNGPVLMAQDFHKDFVLQIDAVTLVLEECYFNVIKKRY